MNPEYKEEQNKATEGDGDTVDESKIVGEQEDAACAAEIAELTQKWEDSERLRLRLQADFDNARRRYHQERSELNDSAQAEVITSLLPILDEFERALSHPVEGADEKFLEGFQLIYRKLVNLLKAYKVEEIVALGEQMDPNYHEAAMRLATDDKPEGEITAVFKKGYRMNDKVLRAAQVQVAHQED